MKKILIIIGLIISLVGCNNPLNKSISEELSIKEIKTISKKDNGFLAFYNKYFENICYESFLKDKTIRVLYSDLTYKRFYNYVLQINNEDFVNSVYNEAEQEWNTQFSNSDIVFDSIISYWINHIAENTLETYVDIEFDHAIPYKGYSEDGIRLYLKISPKRENLRYIKFKYKIATKEDNPKIVVNSSINYNHEFSKPIVISNDERISNNNVFYDDIKRNKLSNAEIKEKYSYYYDIQAIHTQDEILLPGSSEYKDMPFEIEQYIKSPSLSRKESILKKYYDNNYISLISYKNIYLNQKMEEKDNQCYNFFWFIIDCKNAIN